MKKTVTLRRVTSQDAELLARLSWQSFEEAFGADNTPENMAAFLNKHFTPEAIAAELVEPDFEFYIAELADEPVGYLKLEFPAPDAQLPFANPLKINRLYLLRQYLGLGLGDQLMHFSVEKAKLLGCDAIWLTVWEHNPRAISFYEKWGFYQAGTDDFAVGDDVQLDYIMVKSL
ncbi:GNAT family N-acetyltransferase [Adhaeribacter pallidiroseus]|uniref:Putative N-acetyltransferase in pepI 3'region n=1 Tax=Adhaeribacter pallidiroseus TaxID=2072847 RepID=A0A369QS20_9BACT|nr:GNAT family N-acetyltransferase [Adhaeribacter pallidiroseus]RDC64978.1 putative N-acetyltransferase in pepI 3'region [Adhaeribacter pallidiroseus]